MVIVTFTRSRESIVGDSLGRLHPGKHAINKFPFAGHGSRLAAPYFFYGATKQTRPPEFIRGQPVRADRRGGFDKGVGVRLNLIADFFRKAARNRLPFVYAMTFFRG